MLLAIDVGNTHTVLGVLDGRKVEHTFRIRTEARTTDEFGVLVMQLLALRALDARSFSGVICGSVVPSAVYTVAKACRRYLDTECLMVGHGLKTGMKVRTDNPREVGADRIVNAVAAIDRWGGPCVVVDFGTATTVDCVNGRGEYVGGAIAPGFQISEEALVARTAQLPRVEVVRPAAAIGTNTIRAIQSGLYYGYVGLVDHLARRCRDELDPSARVVATGEMATLLAEESEIIDEVDPHLTLRGLAVLYERNAGAR